MLIMKFKTEKFKLDLEKFLQFITFEPRMPNHITALCEGQDVFSYTPYARQMWVSDQQMISWPAALNTNSARPSLSFVRN